MLFPEFQFIKASLFRLLSPTMMAETILQQKFRSIQNCPIPRSWDLRIARADTTKLGWMLGCIRGISDFALVLPTFYAHNEASSSQFSMEVLPTQTHLPLSPWLICSCHSFCPVNTHIFSPISLLLHLFPSCLQLHPSTSSCLCWGPKENPATASAQS